MGCCYLCYMGGSDYGISTTDSVAFQELLIANGALRDII